MELFKNRKTTLEKSKDLPYEFTDYVVRETESPLKFKMMPSGNRKVVKTNVRLITESILKKGSIYRPLIVNGNQEILDGQNRITSAKNMSKFGKAINIPYIVVDGYGQEQVKALNMNQKKLTTEDYLNLWAERGLKDYVNVKELKYRGDYKIPINDFLRICKINSESANSHGILSHPTLAQNELQDGTYTHGDLILAEQFCDWYSNFLTYATDNKIKMKNNFLKIAFKLFLLPERTFDRTRFYSQFKKSTETHRLHVFKDRELVESVQNIYNFNKNKSNRVDLKWELSLIK